MLSQSTFFFEFDDYIFSLAESFFTEKKSGSQKKYPLVTIAMDLKPNAIRYDDCTK